MFFVYSVCEVGVKYGKKVNIFDVLGVNGWFISILVYLLLWVFFNWYECFGFNLESYYLVILCCNDYSVF